MNAETAEENTNNNDMSNNKTLHSTIEQYSIQKVTTQALSMCLLGMIYYAYEYYLRIAPSVMGAELKLLFSLSEASLGHLAACYFYAYTPMQIPIGMMLDRFGPRKILTFACFICAICTYIFATTSNFLVAQIARFLIGFGSAFAYVGVLKISDMSLPPRYFAFMAGLCTALGMMGAIFGQVSMAYMVNTMGWQLTLIYSAIIGIFLAVFLWVFLKESRSQIRKENNRVLADNVKLTVQALKHMSSNAQFWLTGAIGCFTFLPISVLAEMWGVSFLMNIGIDKQAAAWGSSMIFFGFALGGPLWGIISEKLFSRRLPLIWSSFIASILSAWLIWFPGASISILYLNLFLIGFFASCQILVFAVGNDLSDSKVTAVAAAFTNMLVSLGGMALVLIVGQLLDKAMDLSNTLLPTIRDYSVALTAIPIALALAAVLSMVLRETYRVEIK